MKLRNLTLLLVGIFAPMLLFAQPSASPGAGFEWVKTGVNTYTSSGTTLSANFGDADTDPADCSAYCSGNCDGDGLLEKLVFGGTSLPASSCEQRAINLSHWNNTNPESGVSAGATAGTVHLATAAEVEIVESGTKITGSDNKGFIIGGNGPGNFSFFETMVEYSLQWHVSDYNLNNGTGNITFVPPIWNWGEPGNGTQVEMSGWNGYSTAPFETTGGQSYTIPVGSIMETGGNLEVLFEGNMEIFVDRTNGNADGKVQTVPSLEGEASYTVDYDIWEIQMILPVELISFTGEYHKDRIELIWTTATEINSDYFLIERSNNSFREWHELGEVKCAGNSSRLKSYSFIDTQPENHQTYYRLRQVDIDGAETFSNILHVSTKLNSDSYTLYPNPVGDELRLSNESNSLRFISIIDQNGTALINGSFQQEIDTRDLPSGIYTLKIQDESGTLKWSQRFVKL